jgi:MoaA/NifB/PqqE/SkfB family radical SAM enzyme
MARYNRSLLWAAGQFYNRVRQDLSYPSDAGFCKPSRVILCMTLRCNLRCPQCGIWRGDAPGELSTDQWKKVILKLRRWLGPHRIQMAGGEIFIRKDVPELIKFAHDHGVHTGIVSNATLIDEQTAQQLIDSGLQYLDISLDGIRPETHDLLRGRKGTFEKVQKTVHCIKELSRKSDSKLSLLIATVISGKNIDELVPILNWVREQKLSSVSYNPIGPACDSDSEWYNTSELWPRPEDLPRLERVLDELCELKRQGAPIVNSDDQLMEMKRYFRNPAICSNRAKDCRAGQTNFLMSCDGKIHFCFHMTPIGSHEDDFAEVWSSEKAKAARREVKACTYECSPGNLLYRRSILKEIQRYLRFR